MRRILLAFALTGCLATGTIAAEVRVLSGGAVEPGLRAFAAQVKRELGHDLKIEFHTTPQIVKRLGTGDVFDIVIVTPAVIEQATKDRKLVASHRTPVGRVGVGIVVRDPAWAPEVATTEALKQALLGADSVVYNSASSGLYLDKLFGNLGLIDALKAKTTRYPDGASVMEHLIKGKGREIGFGAITEIRLYASKGLTFVGPLPVNVQNYTTYDAALMTGAPSVEAAKAVLRLLATPAGKAAFISAGVE